MARKLLGSSLLRIEKVKMFINWLSESISFLFFLPNVSLLGGYEEVMIALCQGFCTALGTLMQLYHSLPISQPESDPTLALHSEELNAEVIKAISEGKFREACLHVYDVYEVWWH